MVKNVLLKTEMNARKKIREKKKAELCIKNIVYKYANKNVMHGGKQLPKNKLNLCLCVLKHQAQPEESHCEEESYTY